MAHSPEGLLQWTELVSTHFGHLSKPQATVLAWYSFRMLVAQSCGRSSVAAVLSVLTGLSRETLRERLRDWCRDAADKHGDHRQDVDVTQCFAPLLQWVLSWWAPDEHRLALALDATTLGQRFTVLAASVMCCGCAIPVAWVVLPATQPGAWRPHWIALLEQLRVRLPEGWTVIVLTDRGLWARWLYAHIVALSWHPYMRIVARGSFRAQGSLGWFALRDVAPHAGTQWSGRVTCFVRASRQVVCTLMGRWEIGQEEPWLILTDLCPEHAHSLWYGMRSWIEAAFKDTKRGGLHWEQTKMTDPQRAARLWFAIALALLWSVACGASVATQPDSPSSQPHPQPQDVSGLAVLSAPLASTALGLESGNASQGRVPSPVPAPTGHSVGRSAAPLSSPRAHDLSLFRLGLLTLLATLICGDPLPRFLFSSFQWPGDPRKTYP